MLDQLQYCEVEAIPYALVIGESEIEQGVVKLRKIATREEIEIPRDQLIDVLKDPEYPLISNQQEFRISEDINQLIK